VLILINIKILYKSLQNIQKIMKLTQKKSTRGENMDIQLDLQHFCCGPKGCEIEITYGEMMDAE